MLSHRLVLRALAALLAVLAAGPAASARAQLAPERPPLVAAVGDIACDPESPSFHGGEGSEARCRQRHTSDSLLAADPDALLLLGDAQYEDALLWKFQTSYDPTWGRLKGITYPAIGNHEYFTDGAGGYFDYFNGPGAFTGPAGDRDKGYYSFEIGGWHVIALNSVCSQVGGCGPGSPQERWLRADLATHPARCTIAFWHHPYYSSGGMGWPSMEPMWQILYDAGVELVLSGHAHSYERLAPMDATGAVDPAFGIRQFVVGTGGKNLGTRAREHPGSEVFNGETFGSLLLTLRRDGYDWRFLRESGAAFDERGSGSCHGAPSGRPPAAVTGPASDVKPTSAIVNAAVDPHNQLTTFRIEYGPTPAYGLTTVDAPLQAAAGGPEHVSLQLDGLRPGRTYHYRVVATNALGMVVGQDRTFTAAEGSRYAAQVTSTPGLVAHWRLGESDERFTFDGTGRTLGVLSGGYGLGAAGAIAGDADRAVRFDGRDALMRAFGPTLGRDATIEGWFAWEDGKVLLRDDSSSGGWYLARETGGRLSYRVAGRSYRTSRPIDFVRDGAWHHIALTKTGTIAQLFVDGRRVHVGRDTPDAEPTMPWYVMRNGPLEEHARGRADEIAMYDRALPAAEIAARYRAGAGRTAPRTRLRGASGAVRSRQPRLAFASSERGSTFRCRLVRRGSGGLVSPCRSPRPVGPLADGSYRFSVYAIDRAGYPDPTPASRSFTVDTRAPVAGLAARPVGLRTLAGRGLPVRATCDERCSMRLRVTVDRATARRLRLRGRGREIEIARVNRTLSRGRAAFLRVRPASLAVRKRMRRLRRVQVLVRLTARDAAGNAHSLRQPLVLRR